MPSAESLSQQLRKVALITPIQLHHFAKT